jgi:hypothetical protein
MSGVIDGDGWIAARLAFLRGLLDGVPSEEERHAIQAEIDVLSKERGLRQPHYRLLRRPLRWLARTRR